LLLALDEPAKPSRGPLLSVILAVTLASGLALVAFFGFRRIEQQTEELAAQQRDIAAKVTPTSTADATADLVDADDLFTLKWPGPGYKILGEAEARRIGPAAIGGVVADGGCMLLVTAEQIPGGEIEAVTRSFIDGMAAQQKVTNVFEKSTFQGHPAVRFELSAKMQGVPYLFKSTVVERDGWFFQLVSWVTTARRAPCEVRPTRSSRFKREPSKVARRLQKRRRPAARSTARRTASTQAPHTACDCGHRRARP